MFSALYQSNNAPPGEALRPVNSPFVLDRSSILSPLPPQRSRVRLLTLYIFPQTRSIVFSFLSSFSHFEISSPPQTVLHSFWRVSYSCLPGQRVSVSWLCLLALSLLPVCLACVLWLCLVALGLPSSTSTISPHNPQPRQPRDLFSAGPVGSPQSSWKPFTPWEGFTQPEETFTHKCVKQNRSRKVFIAGLTLPILIANHHFLQPHHTTSTPTHHHNPPPLSSTSPPLPSPP